MAYKSSAGKGAFALFMLACMVISALAKSSPKVSHVASAISEAELAVDEFLPCWEALKGLQGCVPDIWKFVFGLPLGTSCCQVFDHITKDCLPSGFPLSQVALPINLQNCIATPAPPVHT